MLWLGGDGSLDGRTVRQGGQKSHQNDGYPPRLNDTMGSYPVGPICGKRARTPERTLSYFSTDAMYSNREKYAVAHNCTESERRRPEPQGRQGPQESLRPGRVVFTG